MMQVEMPKVAVVRFAGSWDVMVNGVVIATFWGEAKARRLAMKLIQALVKQ